jgi:diaminopimelate epimerase
MVDGRLSRPEDWTEADVRTVCARGTGIGADGVVFVTPSPDPGTVRMVYLNSDGSRPAMCGNAALCTARLASRLGLTGGEMRIETDAGTYLARGAPDADRAILQFPPVAAAPGDPQVASCPGERRFAVVAVGVPHLVVLVDDVAAVDLPARGPVLRSSPAVGPDGANVDWVSPGGKATWRMRTYERGVEAETLACGTGAVAVGTALVGWDLATFPVTLITQSGQQMDVQAQRLPGGQVQGVSLTGEARLVFRGVLE